MSKWLIYWDSQVGGINGNFIVEFKDINKLDLEELIEYIKKQAEVKGHKIDNLIIKFMVKLK